jgi:hypothetical protein
MTSGWDFQVPDKKKGAYARPVTTKASPSAARGRWRGPEDYLSDLVLSDLLELPLNTLHLILEAELQLFQTHFFQLFVVREIAFLGK